MEKIGEVSGIEICVTDRGTILLAASCNISEVSLIDTHKLTSLLIHATVKGYDLQNEKEKGKTNAEKA